MFKTQRMSVRSSGENTALTCRGKVLEALVHIWEGKCFGVPEGGENITKSSGDVPKFDGGTGKRCHPQSWESPK